MSSARYAAAGSAAASARSAATYQSQSTFPIPDGIDLNDEKVVANWGVKWDTLHVEYVDENRPDEEIEAVFPASETADYKRPETIEIDEPCDPDGFYPDDEEEE